MKDQIEYIKTWIIKGDHDLGTAKVTYIHIPEYLDTVTFHCQQAIEKYLKAYLIYLSVEFKYTHDLVYLLNRINQKDNDFETYYKSLSEIQGYAVEVRYPDESVYLSNDKVEKALDVAKQVRNQILSKMDISVDYNEIIDK